MKPIVLLFEGIADSTGVSTGGRRRVRAHFTAFEGSSYDVLYYVSSAGDTAVVEDVVIERADGELVLPGNQRGLLEEARPGA